jgi:GntR family transcriptional repressor for pyruvate dehydrogenase complex
MEAALGAIAPFKRPDGEPADLSWNDLDSASFKHEMEADYKFHYTIADAAHNAVLTEMLQTLKEMIVNVSLVNIYDPGHSALSETYHRRILDAIISGDSLLARQLMVEHINTVILGIERIMEQQNGITQ